LGIRLVLAAVTGVAISRALNPDGRGVVILSSLPDR